MKRAPANMVRATPADIILLCQQMREDEREQLAAFFPGFDNGFDPDEAARLLIPKTQGVAFTLLDDDSRPVCAGGWETVADGVMQSWMVGSMAGWEKHWRSITKGSRWLMDTLLESGVRRLQTNALASRQDACRWYVDGLKMRPEGIWRGFGRQGQDVAFFSRLAGE